MQIFELLAEEESGPEKQIRQGTHKMVKEFENVMRKPDVSVAMLSAYFMRLPERYTDVAGDTEQEQKFSNALRGWANKKFLGGSDRDVDNVNLTQLSTAIMDWITKNPQFRAPADNNTRPSRPYPSNTTPSDQRPSRTTPAASNDRNAQARQVLATLGM